ncbi:hypothetical protein [Acinetobacter sp. BSP-28]|uniref:hypothetical protein n=1 Tax=Acinetobacter sp. BSP-28 TaxID=3344661 RepID=UPI00376F7657
MKLSYKIVFYSALILLVYLVVRIIIWQYEEYNERRGYCSAEGKFLTEKEKLQNLRADLVVQDLEEWSQNTDRNEFSRILISKYDLSDKEKIINIMEKSNINKSFKENFGIIAIGTISEYIDRRSCLREPSRCYDFSKLHHSLRSLWKNDNTVDIKYLKNLDKNYSIIINGEGSQSFMASISPLSSIIKTGKNNYQISYYSIYKFCCDRESIKEKTGITNLSNKKKTAEQIQLDYKEISLLHLDQIDGRSRDGIYIVDLFQNLTLSKPELVQKYGLFWSVGSLRSSSYPVVRNITATACGTIVEN